MAFYKKQKQKGKWHPRAITKGRPYTTDDVAARLSLISTVSRGDTYAVLANLGDVLADMMSTGRSVRLMGVGTFYCLPVQRTRGGHARRSESRSDNRRKSALHTRVQSGTTRPSNGTDTR